MENGFESPMRDEAAQQALEEALQNRWDLIQEIRFWTMARRNASASPSSPQWGQPDPIDIRGLMQSVFYAGMRFQKEREE